jgi:hypothetical protein
MSFLLSGGFDGRTFQVQVAALRPAAESFVHGLMLLRKASKEAFFSENCNFNESVNIDYNKLVSKCERFQHYFNGG